MIEANGGPEGLDLAGKDLRGIDLSYETIQAELTRATRIGLRTKPKWVSPIAMCGVNLRGVNFRGSDLDEADLRRAYLFEANVEAAHMWKAHLERANLWRANLQKADLSRANLQRAWLEGADLRKANLWDTNLEKANLEDADLQEAYLSGADLREVKLWGADLQWAWLLAANLQGGDLRRANLQRATLSAADLREALLEGANLQRTNLSGANLSWVNVLGVETMHGTNIYRAILDHTQLTKEQLGGAIGEELEGEWYRAREAYLALKTNFEQIGRSDDAAWAYCKERRMEKLETLQNARRARAVRNLREAFHLYAKVAGDQLIEWLCDYGENFWLVLRAMGAVWLTFALVYCLIAGVWGPWQETSGGQIRYITRNVVDLLSFSLGAMTTLTPTDLEARSMLAMRILMPLEALLGIALAGLLGFVAGNRIRRS